MNKARYDSFTNKYGHFSDDGYEFIVTRPDTPRPWANIISNGDYGLVVTQAGGGFSWKTDVNLNRLTRWNQDLIRDDWGKWLYLRDLDSGELRSLAFQPMQVAYDVYRVHHGLGYSTFVQQFSGLSSEWILFPAKEAPLEIWLVTLKNSGNTPRRLQLASYFEWNLGAGPDNTREFHKLFIETSYHQSLQTLLATKTLWEVPAKRGHWNTDWPFIAFHAVSTPVSGWDTSKDVLIGRNGGFHNPAGIKTGTFSRTSGRFQDAVASLATDLELAPGEEKTVVFLLGMAEKNSRLKMTGKIQQYIEKYRVPENARRELQQVKDFWREMTRQSVIETPDDAFDLLTNIWLKYQVYSGHLWARSGYYQQSGAFGFRDQLQTSQAWLLHAPEKMLEHIRFNARHQFRKGTVLHWWHPITEQGLATNMSDDLLWLPFMLNRYLQETANFAALSETIPFYDGGEATLQEHALKAIEVTLQRFSDRGLPLIGEGDWCDGFSALGLDWKGESIWLGMFLYRILLDWAELLSRHSPEQKPDLAEKYCDAAEKLKAALNREAWNGQWYTGATRDDGKPIGDPSAKECKIYLMAQTWAILSGVAVGERRQQVVQAMLEHLEGDNGFLLLYPAFQTPDENVGYITRYAPGLRENGGVYTHAATWGVMALAEMGLAADAMRHFRKLNPILQVHKDANRYVAEPYVLPGNIDGKDSPYYGRAGWTWYTGSAAWLLTIAYESIAGLKPVQEGLKIDPCILSEWPQVKILRKFRGAEYHITIKNPEKQCGGVKEIRLNGKTISGNVIPQQPAGSYAVEVTLTGREGNRRL